VTPNRKRPVVGFSFWPGRKTRQNVTERPCFRHDVSPTESHLAPIDRGQSNHARQRRSKTLAPVGLAFRATRRTLQPQLPREGLFFSDRAKAHAGGKMQRVRIRTLNAEPDIESRFGLRRQALERAFGLELQVHRPKLGQIRTFEFSGGQLHPLTPAAPQIPARSVRKAAGCRCQLVR
jgi:hypothetical protein